jgi:Tol biopolymer transport system component
LGLALLLSACGGGNGNNNQQSSAPSMLTGTFYGPIGSQVTLQANGGNDKSVIVQALADDPYNAQNFSFAPLWSSGTTYQVTLKTTPAGQTCEVFKGASGIMPAATGSLHVGCEITDDLVSRNSDAAASLSTGNFASSSAPVVGGANVAIGSTTKIYGEGRFVAFVSSASLATGTTGAHLQVFWRDRYTGITVLVSASEAGVEGNGDSGAPAISADGLTVAFESQATNLGFIDTNAARDVFVWNAPVEEGVPPVVVKSVLRRASIDSVGVEANGESFEPTLSGDGRVIAFSTNASNLTGVTGTATTNVVRRDLVAGSNRLVSADVGGTGRGGAKPMLSENGSRLVFWSSSDQLVGATGDSNGLWDIFVFDSTVGSAGTTTCVSLTGAPGGRNQGSEAADRLVAPAISGNGRFVAYATTATNLVAGDNNSAQDVFVVDTLTGTVTRASVATGASNSGTEGNADSPVGPGERPALSYDGSWVAFSSLASNLGATASNVLMHNRVTGETRVVSNQSTGLVGAPAMSRDGGYVVFGSGAALDSRFASTGLFAHFTQLAASFWWLP